MQRLGWLLVVIFCVLKVAHFSRAFPIDPTRVASELKVNSKVIRVKLSDLGSDLFIKGNGLAASLAARPELGNVRSDEWSVDCKNSRILEPTTGKSRRIPRSGILLESITGILNINGRHFRDQIVVYPKDLLSPYDSSLRNNPQCLVVNHLPVERYLESVVNGEFNSKWAEPAVEAQIIAARTYAYYQMREMRKDRGRVFDVESTQKDQVYLGMDVADSKAAELVQKTRGMILVDPMMKKKDPIKAFYHSSCGGGTFLPGQIWGGKLNGFKKVRCIYCVEAPSFEWTYSLNLREIESRIWKGLSLDPVTRKGWPKTYLNEPNRWSLSLIKIQRNEERTTNVILQFQDLETFSPLKVTMNAYQFRNWLDPAKLKSTRFKLDLHEGQVTFTGKGSGHGVGLCQWGAKRMGEKGFNREQILSHYYPGFRISKLL